MSKAATRNPWAWIPTLYFAEGLPYVFVMTVSVIMYKRLDISNTDIALYTSWLYLPWVIKPLWSPIVDILKTKRYWIVVMQLVVGAALAGIAFTLPASNFFQYTIAFFWLMAFSSATHDIAADGFYMLGLSKHDQAFFVGIRNTFYRFAMLAGQGPLVILAGEMEKIAGDDNQWAWSITFFIFAALFLAFFIWHLFILPRPVDDVKRESKSLKQVMADFVETFVTFFKKDGIVLSLVFILIFRLGEAQLVKLATPFLLDDPEVGGLGLSTSNIGFVYGTAGMIALTLGGIIGGILVSRNGLKHWMLPMVLAMNLPNLMFVLLAYVQPESLWIITGSVIIEQFGYGFGFTAFMLYMIYVADGEHKTAHYALCTGFMALGMMLPGMISGWIQEMIGYQYFFIWVMLCTIPGFIIVNYLRYDPKFGMKNGKEQ
ncbi:MFS transporter, PAT family, beta-lactamase induction signal transducer AmpG [Tangfeifania diversioriginum]|uniref:MFS transporter, PAT family, beta-lactamase induction signal transducer AmpG n=1 Tax=Tangfeifania diversioriginum TaxID=1168035 RepID=A0A1M6L4Q7_9BACT|nr:AmpG family muropeptide MFS transporter [Tangfeifania diversioriginum]SHJ66166.1 MFS transporter, PAT family, beta-lactamase induction signal transducer AmpG [Tangfeifania diversioriginum]